MQFKELLDKLETGQLYYDNVYNAELEVAQYYAIQHYIQHPKDNIDLVQNLHVVYNDIEVYTHNTGKFKVEEGCVSPISAITIYSTIEKCYTCYFLVLDIIKNIKIDIKSLEIEIKNEIFENKDGVKTKYIKDDENCKILLYTDELKMISDVFKKIHSINAHILSGFNSDKYDAPYTYGRLLVLLGDKQKVANIMSNIGIIKEKKMGKKGTFIIIPDLPSMDIKYLYTPRGEKINPGLNYGKIQASYSLDWISDAELGLKKLDYKDDGTNLDKLYETNPGTYIKYNIIDVVLCRLLDLKLKHIELHNMLRRDMKTPLGLSMRGPAALFDTYFSYTLEQKNLKVKHGISKESFFGISQSEIDNIVKPKDTRIKWKIENGIEKEIYQKILSRYIGAYVKEGYGKIVDHVNGVICDLDAKSLYPSKMQENNISFDTYWGRIIDPLVYNLLENYIAPVLGTNNAYHNAISMALLEDVYNFVEKLAPQNKSQYAQYMYFILMYLLNKLKKINKPLKDLLNPKTREDWLTSKIYLIPFLDLYTDIHPKSIESNSFCYDYLLNGEINSKYIYNIENIVNPNLNINKIPGDSIYEYLIKNNVNLNLSGCMFYTHEYKLGIMNEFLNNRISMRDVYKSERKKAKTSHGVDSFLYQLNDQRQNAMKINANSSYGLTGMSGFRFSNKWLAMSVTISGRLCLKIAQMCGELILEDLNIGNLNIEM